MIWWIKGRNGFQQDFRNSTNNNDVEKYTEIHCFLERSKFDGRLKYSYILSRFSKKLQLCLFYIYIYIHIHTHWAGWAEGLSMCVYECFGYFNAHGVYHAVCNSDKLKPFRSKYFIHAEAAVLWGIYLFFNYFHKLLSAFCTNMNFFKLNKK